MTDAWLTATEQGVRLLVFAVPRASKTSVEGLHDGRLRVRVAAPPVDGEANRELVRFFANLFDVSKSAVSVDQGSTGRRKTLAVEGVDVATVRERLGGIA